MAKKIFYNRHYKMPGWLQFYAVWAFVALITLVVVFFTSVESIPNEPVATLPAAPNKFAEGLFYELREAEPAEKYEVTLRYAERLKKKYGYALRETNSANCRVINLTRGRESQWLVAAALQNGHIEGVFSVLVFLDRIAASSPTSVVSAALVFTHKNCKTEEAVQTLQNAQAFLVFVDAENNPAPNDRINAMRNLNLRRYFPAAFLMLERTHWANILALATDEAAGRIFTVPAGRAKDSLTDLLAANPLLRHPAQTNANAQQLSKPVAIYLGNQTQLHTGGFTALLLLVWLLALIPFTNALMVFGEKMDLSSAFTSGILYALAFLSYLFLFKLLLQFSKSDFTAIVFAALLVPAVFFPLRILQKTMLRAELNRPGLHLMVQVALSIALFISPLVAAAGLLQLTAASGFSRANQAHKLFRLIVVLSPLALLYFTAREPMGNLTNFLTAILPGFAGASLLKLILLCIVGGNLTALLFVPRERL